MSLQEVQTAAARVIHVDHIDDRSLQELKTRFHYHPLDIEALFVVPVEPLFSAYATYGFMTLLWPDTRTNDSTGLRFFVDKQQLTIVGDTSEKTIGQFIERLRINLGTPESELTAPELIHELLQLLRQPWKSNQANINAGTQHWMIGNAQVVRQLGRWLQTVQLPIAVPHLVIDAHTLDSLAEQPVQTKEIPATKRAPILPSLLRGYALASALMVIVILVTLTVR